MWLWDEEIVWLGNGEDVVAAQGSYIHGPVESRHTQGYQFQHSSAAVQSRGPWL